MFKKKYLVTYSCDTNPVCTKNGYVTTELNEDSIEEYRQYLRNYNNCKNICILNMIQIKS